MRFLVALAVVLTAALQSLPAAGGNGRFGPPRPGGSTVVDAEGRRIGRLLERGVMVVEFEGRIGWLIVRSEEVIGAEILEYEATDCSGPPFVRPNSSAARLVPAVPVEHIAPARRLRVAERADRARTGGSRSRSPAGRSSDTGW